MIGICAITLFACKDDKKTEATPDTSAKVKEMGSDVDAKINGPEATSDTSFEQDSINGLAIKGYKVKLVSGKHKYGGKTNIEYKSLHEVLRIPGQRQRKKCCLRKIWILRSKI